MAPKNPFRRDGKTYNWTVEDVAEAAGRTTRWVYSHTEALGGRKEAWIEGNLRQTLRFCERDVRRILKEMGLIRPKRSKG